MVILCQRFVSFAYHDVCDSCIFHELSFDRVGMCWRLHNIIQPPIDYSLAKLICKATSSDSRGNDSVAWCVWRSRCNSFAAMRSFLLLLLLFSEMIHFLCHRMINGWHDNGYFFMDYWTLEIHFHRRSSSK